MSNSEYINILEELRNNKCITDIQYSVIKSRYINQIQFYKKKLNRYSTIYNIFRFNVTFGSLIVPALLSIQNTDNIMLKDVTYWSTWALSLLVTTCNGLIGLFSLDKNYIMYGLTLEKMNSEGWQFVQLSGKYEDCDTHQEAYSLFCKNIEYIKIKQIQQEYAEGGKSKGLTTEKKEKQNNNNNNNNEFMNSILSQLSVLSNGSMNNVNAGTNALRNGANNTVMNNTNNVNNVNATHNDINTMSNDIENSIENNPNYKNEASIKATELSNNMINDVVNNLTTQGNP